MYNDYCKWMQNTYKLDAETIIVEVTCNIVVE